MKICPKCGISHEKNGMFCSRKCANSRQFSVDAIRKKSEALKGRKVGGALHEYDEAARIEKVKTTWKAKYDATPFDELGWKQKRKYIIHEQENKCNKCGVLEWMGHPLSLEVDHIDGNNQNNKRENLEALCPNCHSITETWRGRNKPVKNGKNVVSDEILLQALKECDTIRQALLMVGLSAKGYNYTRAKKLLEIN